MRINDFLRAVTCQRLQYLLDHERDLEAMVNQSLPASVLMSLRDVEGRAPGPRDMGILSNLHREAVRGCYSFELRE
ncbi:MAG: hypothetical protein ACP5FT_04375 [Acidilobus sp.]